MLLNSCGSFQSEQNGLVVLLIRNLQITWSYTERLKLDVGEAAALIVPADYFFTIQFINVLQCGPLVRAL